MGANVYFSDSVKVILVIVGVDSTTNPEYFPVGAIPAPVPKLEVEVKNTLPSKAWFLLSSSSTTVLTIVSICTSLTNPWLPIVMKFNS